MIATVANMRRVYPEDRVVLHADGMIRIETPKPFAYSPGTGERFSANPADYWNEEDEDRPLCDEYGEPMVLAFERSGIEIIEA